MTHTSLPITTLLITAEDAAKALKLSRSTIYELIATGNLESIKVGRARRIRWTDLQTYVNSLTECEV